MTKTGMLAVASVLIGCLIMLHQYVVWGHIWDFEQIHHETLFIGLIAFALGLEYLNLKKRVKEEF